MKKFKGFSGKKIHEGELYIFKNGIAVVPNFRYRHFPVKVTLKEFNEYTK